MWYLILLIIHLFICLILYISIRTGAMEVTSYLLPIAIFIPVFGFIALVICDRLAKNGKANTKELELEDLMLRADDFRRIKHEDEKTVKTVVPLEEAIRINDTQIRRKLMMDIMKQDPDKYIKLLQQARLNDDMEVTHYASTAMMEVQRKYEIELQRYEKELQVNPEDTNVLNTYLKVLKRYIESGMLEDNMLVIQRVRFDSLLKKKIAEFPSEKQPYIDLAENLIELSYFDEAEKTVRYLTHRWPNDENMWVAKLKLCFASGNKKQFDETVSEIKERKIYFSSQFKDLLTFWDSSVKEYKYTY
ncbi:MAG: hypothetical protein A2Y15_00230 [Clostridiales bacterium GWF2_36_10]|nr:MAG: hypothetical protein A2Y15_00230 [Clostridiales bacterium GWF2_36_10]HAN21783.1 hypothetical protein [Clostridiales bacterium]